MKNLPLKLIIFSLFILAIAGSLFLAHFKRTALSYGEVDYPFYVQFAARLSDPQLSDSYSIQPQGYNFMGYMGPDGRDNLHQSIHFEPIKYVYALLYRLIPSPSSISLFIAFIYFIPIVYLVLIHPMLETTDQFFVILFALLYIGIPSTFEMVTYDLRPRILLIPAFTLATLSIHYQRPLSERFLTFGFLFLIREEALLFGLILLLYNFLRSVPGRERTLSTIGFGLIWLIFLIIILGYFRWTGYSIDPVYQPLYLFFSLRRLYRVLIIGIGLIAVLVFGWQWYQSRKTPWMKDLLQILICASVFIPLLLQLSTTLTNWLLADDPSTTDVLTRFLFSPNTTMFFVAGLILLVLIRNIIISRKLLSATQVTFFLVGIVFLGLQSSHLSKTLADYATRSFMAKIVFQLRSETDASTSRILTDYSTYQAFFDYEHVYLYPRLPWQIAGQDRYYPDNLPYLQQLLKDGVDTIIIGTESKQDIQNLLATINLQPVSVIENESYQILHLP